MRPAETEYAEYYAKYIHLVPGDDVLNVLNNHNECINLLRSLPEERAGSAYAPGKWTVKQLIIHMLDTERIMAYRALRIARNDKQPLPGFDQDEYAKFTASDKRKLKELIDEFELMRKSNILLFRSFGEEELKRTGTASGYGVSVLALLFIIAGHELHHCNILKERYL